MTVGVQARELVGTGGTHTYLRNVLPPLTEYCGDELMLFHAADRSSVMASNGTTHVDSKTNRPILSDHVILPYLLRRHDVDVTWFPKNVIPFAHDGPSVVTVHDLGHFVHPKFYPPIDRVYMKGMLRYSCRVADRIVAISEHTKRDVVRYTAASEDDVEVIYHGVDDRFRIEPTRGECARFREEYDLEPTTVYGGNIGRRKNICRLVDAFGHATATSGKDTELVFTGARPNRKQMRKIAEHDSVRYLGYVPLEDLPLLYRVSSAFVYPSLYEGFGLPPLEAMACETPVVAAETASIPEVVGEGGVLVDPHDVEGIATALDRVLTEDGTRRRLIRTGRRRAAAFSWENAAQKLADVFDDVAQV